VIFFRQGVGLFWQAADGSGHEEALSTTASPGMLPSGVTPDGTQVLFTRGPLDVMAMRLDDRRVERLVQTPFYDRNGVVSPKGNWLAYESNETETFEIYVVPYPNVKNGRPRRVSTAGGTRPLWSRNRRELFFVAPDGAIMAASVDARGSVAPGAPVKVVDAKYSTGHPASGRNYDVSADGTRFLMVKAPPNDQADAPQIQRVEHWTEELQRLVPAPK
jgi:serine/threonine-protein kinase